MSLIIDNYLRDPESTRGFDHAVVSVTGTEPVTVDEFKLYAKIEGDDEDALLAILLSQAISLCESYISRDIVAKRRVDFYTYIRDCVRLSWGDYDSIVSISIDGEFLTEGTGYEVEGVRLPVIKFLQTAYDEPINITYDTTGLSDNGIKGAILRMATNLYESRNDEASEYTMESIPQDVTFLLSPYKTGASIILH